MSEPSSPEPGGGRLNLGQLGPSLAGTAILASTLLVVVALTSAMASAADTNIVLGFLVNLTIVVGLQSFAGNSGIMSFGHVGLMAVGAYTAAMLTTEPAVKEFSIPRAPHFLQAASLGWVPSTLIAMVVTMIFALVVGIAIVRLTGAAAAVGTLGLLVIVFVVLSNYDQLTRGAKAFYGAPAYTTLWTALAGSVAALLAARLFRESRTGLMLRSSRAGHPRRAGVRRIGDPRPAGGMGGERRPRRPRRRALRRLHPLADAEGLLLRPHVHRRHDGDRRGILDVGRVRRRARS